jgi:hypothetical protein
MITNDARCTREIECGIVMAKTAFNTKKAFSLANWGCMWGRSWDSTKCGA